jgi:hypothetical protein
MCKDITTCVVIFVPSYYVLVFYQNKPTQFLKTTFIQTYALEYV